MKLFDRLLSGVLSCACAGAFALSSAPAAFAASDEDIILPATNNNTIQFESKVSHTTTLTGGQADDWYDEGLSGITTTSTTVMTTTAPTTTASETTSTTVSSTAASVPSTVSSSSQEPFNVFDIYNAHKGYVTSTTPARTSFPPSFTPDPSMYYRKAGGIDVSQWQGKIDWAKVKEAGVEFVIVRAGYGKYASQKDPTFDYNVQQAQANGIAVGAYWYSYATTVEAAKQEAEVCYEVIKNYEYQFPIYFDIEDPCQSKLSAAEVSAICEAFCSTLESKGYRTGLYSYVNFLSTKIYDTVREKYDVWVANFDVASPYYSDHYEMWQYTAKGSVDGISGDLDMDIAYVNYPYLASPDSYVYTPETTSVSVPIRPVVTTPATPEGGAAGIDVSEWQKTINWNDVKNDGSVDYAILRAGYGRFITQKDKNFEYNYEQARSKGIGVGAYWYSYAKTPEAALEEAKVCCEVLAGRQFEYPIYFDIEDASIANMSKAELTKITETFCSYLEEQGYYAGITSYSNFLNSKLDSSLYKKYDVWVAHYNVNKPSYTGPYNMWQYSCTSSVPGITGDVDRDVCYVDFPAIMKENHINGY